MRSATIAIALVSMTALFSAIVPTSSAVGTCSSLLDARCPALFCYGTSGGQGDPYYECQYEVPGRLPIVNAVSNCGGVAPLKTGCSGAGLLDDRWWVEVRAAPAFPGVVHAVLSTDTGSFSVSCTIPTATSGGACSQSLTGTIGDQSFELSGWVAPIWGIPMDPVGHWLISVYSA